MLVWIKMKIICSTAGACNIGRENHPYADREPNIKLGSLQSAIQHAGAPAVAVLRQQSHLPLSLLAPDLHFNPSKGTQQHLASHWAQATLLALAYTPGRKKAEAKIYLWKTHSKFDARIMCAGAYLSLSNWLYIPKECLILLTGFFSVTLALVEHSLWTMDQKSHKQSPCPRIKTGLITPSRAEVKEYQQQHGIDNHEIIN